MSGFGNKKKVLMVSCDGLGNGGVQAVMMSVVRSLSDSCDFDMLLFTNEVRHYEEEFLSSGGRIIRLPKYEGPSALRRKVDYYIRGNRLYRRALSALRKYGPYDIIHCNNGFEGGILLKAAQRAGIPVRIMHAHVIASEGNILSNALDSHRKRLIGRYATAKIGCSEDACRSLYSGSDHKVIVNAYDERRFDRSRFTEAPENPPVLVQIGSFVPVKNQKFSVSVLKELTALLPEAELKLVGFRIGDYEDSLREQIRRLGLSDKIEFLPHDCDTPELLSRSSYLLLPSLKEGFGIVLIEAQAMGLTCFASDSVPKETDRGGVRFLSLSAGAAAWAKHIAEDYSVYRGRHARYEVADHTTRSVAEQYKKLYGVN